MGVNSPGHEDNCLVMCYIQFSFDQSNMHVLYKVGCSCFVFSLLTKPTYKHFYFVLGLRSCPVFMCVVVSFPIYVCLTARPPVCLQAHELEGVADVPLHVINNYFSIGADAHVSLEFHLGRREPPLLSHLPSPSLPSPPLPSPLPSPPLPSPLSYTVACSVVSALSLSNCAVISIPRGQPREVQQPNKKQVLLHCG